MLYKIQHNLKNVQFPHSAERNLQNNPSFIDFFFGEEGISFLNLSLDGKGGRRGEGGGVEIFSEDGKWSSSHDYLIVYLLIPSK